MCTLATVNIRGVSFISSLVANFQPGFFALENLSRSYRWKYSENGGGKTWVWHVWIKDASYSGHVIVTSAKSDEFAVAVPASSDMTVSPMLEQPWQLSKAPAGNKFGAFALAAANIGGVAYLSNLVANLQPGFFALNNLAWIPSVLPALQAYAALFLIIPAVRLLWNSLRNAEIALRNGARQRASEVCHHIP